MIAQVMPVNPDIGVHVNTIKSDVGLFAFIALTKGKALAVPAYTSFRVTRSTFSNRGFGKRTLYAALLLVREVFNTPVMGQVNLSPGCVVVVRLLGLPHTVFCKKPGLIK